MESRQKRLTQLSGLHGSGMRKGGGGAAPKPIRKVSCITSFPHCKQEFHGRKDANIKYAGEKVYYYGYGSIPFGAGLPSQRRNQLLPTKDQCFALTDEQCRRIQDILDPDERRFQRGWELKHQPELIRLYMTGMSFQQMVSAMTPRLTWS